MGLFGCVVQAEIVATVLSLVAASHFVKTDSWRQIFDLASENVLSVREVAQILDPVVAPIGVDVIQD